MLLPHMQKIPSGLFDQGADVQSHRRRSPPYHHKGFDGKKIVPNAMARPLLRAYNGPKDKCYNGTKGRGMDWIHQRVHFKICDVYHPNPIRILTDLHCNDLLSGKIIDLSDSGMQKNAFAVIEVEEIQEWLVVPIERVMRTIEEGNGNEPTR
jgi:hypothetical protein